MRSQFAAFGLLLGALTPALAQAKAVEEVTVQTDGADVIVTVLADEALNAPTVRTYSGLVRVRFYDASDLPLLKVDGDGGALRMVELTRGSDRSAALTMTLADNTKLAPSDVRVERNGERTQLRIARGLLPAVQATTAAAAAPARVVPPPAKPVSAAQVAPTSPPVVAAAPVAVEVAPKAAAPEPAASAKAAPALGLGTKPEASKKPLKLASDESSPMPLLIALTALLAVAYGALRMFMQKKGKSEDIPSINVVAQKRLGPRHQLVIVRAFDRDYLLSIQGGQTTVVARSTRRAIEAAEELLAPIPRGSSAPAGRDFEDDEPTFGGELFKQALEQRERAREQTQGYKLESGRDQTQGYRLESARAQARAALAREEPRPTAIDNDNDAESARELGISEPSTDGISESVSGLLRLRRKASRG